MQRNTTSAHVERTLNIEQYRMLRNTVSQKDPPHDLHPVSTSWNLHITLFFVSDLWFDEL